MSHKILYISYDGMTDPLGQSQVIPYLAGLAQKGFEIHLLSCEKTDRLKTGEAHIRSKLSDAEIHWHPISYSKTPPVLSTLWDIVKLKLTASRLHRKYDFSIVHCRSYIAALVGLWIKRKSGVKFVFDMRGFWVEERIEGGIWNPDSMLFRAIIRYFKRKEVDFLAQSDVVISLTERAKEDLSKRRHGPSASKIQVIPCCVDTNLFSLGSFSQVTLLSRRNDLSIDVDAPVICYLGAIGTWYMLDEMLAFFKLMLAKEPKAVFLFVTQEQPDAILRAASRLDIPVACLRICAASRNEVPALIALASLSVFFIRPTYSKTASSPTKLAELMAMGLPVICNRNVGDLDSLGDWRETGVYAIEPDINGFADALYNLQALKSVDPNKIRAEAKKLFDLQRGIDRYEKVYRSLLDT